MTPERFYLEKKALGQFLPPNAYLFKDMDTAHPYVLMGVRTNRGNIYTLRVDLEGFPNTLPKAFVTKMLYTKNGKRMDSASGAMHTLTSEHGYTRICHYGYDSWHSNVSIAKVYVKCRCWLEIYELHLQTGKEMQYYLSHQS